MTEEAQEMFKRLLTSRNCFLATSTTDGKPEGAVMHFVADEDGTIYLKTFNDNRKYANLKSNPRVSIAIYNKPDYVQMQGSIEELEEIDVVKEKFLSKFSEDEYYNDKRMRYFKCTPNWIRVRLKGTYPPKFEMIRG